MTCITHRHACDCREAANAKAISDFADSIIFFKDLSGLLNIQNDALRAELGKARLSIAILGDHNCECYCMDYVKITSEALASIDASGLLEHK